MNRAGNSAQVAEACALNAYETQHPGRLENMLLPHFCQTNFSHLLLPPTSVLFQRLGGTPKAHIPSICKESTTLQSHTPPSSASTRLEPRPSIPCPPSMNGIELN